MSGSFFPNLPITVRICSWNVGGQPLHPKDDLKSLLFGNAVDNGVYGLCPAICAIGVQEILELSSRNIFWASSQEEEKPQLDFESRLIEEFKQSGCDYVKVGSVGMVGLYLAVYIRAELAHQVSDVAVDRVKTGVLHLAGNKGGVCIRFDLDAVSMCFLNLHLAAGHDNQAARDRDIDSAIQNSFQELGSFGTFRTAKLNFNRMSDYSVVRHDFVAAFGDFNFRTDLPQEEFPAGHYRTWLAYDAWCSGRVKGLEEFTEGSIGFPPTYKYEVGSEKFDEKRLPAWCDRVFYKVSPLISARVRDYTSFPALRHTSDHRPVAAVIQVDNTDQRPDVCVVSSRSWMEWPSRLSKRLGGSFRTSSRLTPRFAEGWCFNGIPLLCSCSFGNAIGGRRSISEVDVQATTASSMEIVEATHVNEGRERIPLGDLSPAPSLSNSDEVDGI